MTSGDETYLEAFMDSLSTLPPLIRRNMDLMRDLDASNSKQSEELRRLQQDYLQEAEERVLQLEVVEQENPKGRGREGGGESSNKRLCIRVLGSSAAAATNVAGESSSSAVEAIESKQAMETDDNKEASSSTGAAAAATTPSTGEVRKQQQQDPSVTIPTTAELFLYTLQEDRFDDIQTLQFGCLQKADETMAIARQTYDMVHAVLQRLDKDIHAMETLLQSTGDFLSATHARGAGGGHAGVAASGGAHHHPAKPNDLAACQVSPGSEWILAKVLHHDPATGIYKLADEDVESNKIFHLPESQVVLTGVEKLSKGDFVYAVYPDTTSFYAANVVQAPRKVGERGGAASSRANLVMVNFVDDSDEFGITHDKAIPLQHIIIPPYGGMMQ